jgi:hypothetical protein
MRMRPFRQNPPYYRANHDGLFCKHDVRTPMACERYDLCFSNLHWRAEALSGVGRLTKVIALAAPKASASIDHFRRHLRLARRRVRSYRPKRNGQCDPRQNSEH